MQVLADAIDRSALVLICYSEAYKRSGYCRMESEYAFKQKKPLIFVRLERSYEPDGWLGFFLGNSIYYDVSGTLFERRAAALAEDLLMRLRGERTPEGKELHGNKFNGKTKTHAAPSAGPFLLWTEEQVQKWLVESGMDFLCDACDTFTLLYTCFVFYIYHNLLFQPPFANLQYCNECESVQIRSSARDRGDTRATESAADRGDF